MNVWKKSSRRATSVSLKWASFPQPLRVHLHQTLQQEPLNRVLCSITLPPGPGCDLWSGIQVCRHRRGEVSSLFFPGCFSLYLVNTEISALLVFCHEIIFSQPLWAQQTEELFLKGLFLQLCSCFPFLAQGRLWALVLRQGHPFTALIVLGDEVVFAPGEGSLPAPGLFLHLGFGNEGAQACLWAAVHQGRPHL